MAANVERQAENKPEPSPCSFHFAKISWRLFKRGDEWNWREQFELIIGTEFGKCKSEFEGVVPDACLP